MHMIIEITDENLSVKGEHTGADVPIICTSLISCIFKILSEVEVPITSELVHGLMEKAYNDYTEAKN